MKFISINMKGDEANAEIIQRIGNCEFDMYQDTNELNIWEKMNGQKDSIYIFSKDGSLMKQLDPYDSDMGAANPMCTSTGKPEAIQTLLTALKEVDDFAEKQCKNEFFVGGRKISKRKQQSSFSCEDKDESEKVPQKKIKEKIKKREEKLKKIEEQIKDRETKIKTKEERLEKAKEKIKKKIQALQEKEEKLKSTITTTDEDDEPNNEKAGKKVEKINKLISGKVDRLQKIENKLSKKKEKMENWARVYGNVDKFRGKLKELGERKEKMAEKKKEKIERKEKKRLERLQRKMKNEQNTDQNKIKTPPSEDTDKEI